MTQATATWARTGKGTFRFSWDLATNWSPAAVPNDTGATVYKALLTQGGSAYTVVASGAHEIGLLQMDANATLTINKTGDFTIDNALDNAGVINVAASPGGFSELNLGTASTPSFSYGNSGTINVNGGVNLAFLLFNATATTELVGGGVINLSGMAQHQ